ncbi:MAG: acylneuraminate cytidylyltransferase family protein [Solirubrobacteraceae bacterium]
MRTAGVIPARGGSRRVPGKNLAVVGGRTLVRRALETALGSGVLDPVVLSSDDPAILAEADGLEGVVALVRPVDLATATARSLDVVQHALAALGEHVDAVAIMQCTSPFTAPGDVAGVVALLEVSGAESAVTISPVGGVIHPYKLKRLVEDDRLVPWLTEDGMVPSHELPDLWARNGCVYVTRSEVIARGEIVGGDARGFRMPEERSVDIDTPLDLAFAQFLNDRGPLGCLR